MDRPRTYSVERESEIRKGSKYPASQDPGFYIDAKNELLIELDAERLAHAETQEQLAQARERIDALEDGMNPQDVCNIDAALRAKQEPPQHAQRPAEGAAEDTSGLQGGKP